MSVRFAIVGAGKVGTALARLLSKAGYEFAGAASRTLQSAQAACSLAGGGQAATTPAEVTREADLVFITTLDDVIQDVFANIARAGAFRPGAVVAHCSGAHSSGVLVAPGAEGVHAGSFHPLQTFATADETVGLLPGSYCCIEGDETATTLLGQVAADLRMHPLAIASEDKALYHAAAVMSCNYLVALQNAAVGLMEAAGISRQEALRALLPLIEGTVHNLGAVGLADSLTGPVSRGDAGTVRRHVEAISSRRPELLPLYRLLGLEAVRVALAKGTLRPDGAEELRRLLQAQ